MPQATPLINSFNAGEQTPRIGMVRTDLNKYYNGCRTLENFLILPEGGVTRRGGFHYVASGKTAGRKVRLVPFKFSTTQAYIVEFGHQYIRFYMNHGQIWSVDSYTKSLLHGDGDDLSTTITDDGYSGGHTWTVLGNPKIKTDQKKFGSASMYFPGVHQNYIYSADHADWHLGTDTFCIDLWAMWEALPATYSPIFIRNDGSVFIWFGFNKSPSDTLQFHVYNSTSLVNLQYSFTPTLGTWYHFAIIRGWGGNADDFAMCLNGAAVATQTASVTLPDISTAALFFGENPYDNAALFKGWIDEFRWSKGTARWTANFSPPTAPYPYSADGGSAVYEIVSPYSEEHLDQLQFTQSNDVLFIDHPAITPRELTRTGHAAWSLTETSFTSAPASWGSGSRPRAVFFHDQRLGHCGPPGEPGEVALSKSADIDNFTTGTSDEDAVIYYLYSDDVQQIVWGKSIGALVIGTVGGVFRLTGGENGITPTSISANMDISHGCEAILPVRIGSVLIYVQSGKRKVRQISYSWESDKLISQNLNRLCEHITLGGILELAYQQEPHSIVWARRGDGVLLAMTYLPQEEVIGWARHITDGIVESIACIPTADGSEDELWAAIKRTIDGEEFRYIEYLDPNIMVDSGLTYSGAPIRSVTGLSHLEGKAVDVVADGVVVTGKTVESGAITLETAASEIQAGLHYDSVLEPNRINAGSVLGSAIGKPQRINKLTMVFYESAGGQYGPDADNLIDIPYGVESLEELFTGDVDAHFGGDWGREATIYIKQDQPLAMTVLGLIPRVNLNED